MPLLDGLEIRNVSFEPWKIEKVCIQLNWIPSGVCNIIHFLSPYRELQDGYYQLKGFVCLDAASLTKEQVQYKYVVQKDVDAAEKPTYKWEWIHIEANTIWNRVLSIPANSCKAGGM